MTDDPFRYCIFCGADCDEYEPEHTDGCPSSTGVFPITERELEPHGMRCMDCHDVFAVGDSYTHRWVDEGDPLLPGIEGAAIGEIICLGCAALAECVPP